MVWFYTRADERVRIETRLQASTNEYVLQVECLGRPVVIERFADAETFDVRVREFERELDAESWQLVGNELLAHGWRGPFIEAQVVPSCAADSTGQSLPSFGQIPN
jgi:hypothetical protein